MTLAVRSRHLLLLGLMYGIRYAPLPGWLKGRAIWLAQPKVVQVGVAVISDAEGQVLLLRARYSGRWLLPGGGVYPGEDPRSGVLRECREELGQEVTLQRLTGIYADGVRRHVIFAFRAAPLTHPPTLSEEHDAYRYDDPALAVSPLGPIARDALADHPEVRIARATRGQATSR